MATTMTAKAQVTIPKAVRDKVGIQPGDRVEVRVGNSGEIIVDRVATINKDRDWLDKALAKIHARRGSKRGQYSTDEIMKKTRGED